MSEYVSTLSSFSELFPDRINVPIIRGLEGTRKIFLLLKVFSAGPVPNDMVQYEMNIGGTERFSCYF